MVRVSDLRRLQEKLVEIFQSGSDRLQDALINRERWMVHSWRTEVQVTLKPAQTTGTVTNQLYRNLDVDLGQ